MARLLIYDAYENKVYTYANLNENDPMPYSTLTTLRLREFRGKSASPTLWTTIAAMEAWNLLLDLQCLCYLEFLLSDGIWRKSFFDRD